MKRYALDRIGLYWEMKDEDTSEVLVRSSSKQAAILKATEVGIQTGGRLNIFKKTANGNPAAALRARGIEAHGEPGAN